MSMALAKASFAGGASTDTLSVAIRGGAVTHWPTEMAYFVPPVSCLIRSLPSTAQRSSWIPFGPPLTTFQMASSAVWSPPTETRTASLAGARNVNQTRRYDAASHVG